MQDRVVKFVRQVQFMREQQRLLFDTYSPAVLRQATSLGLAVDREAKELIAAIEEVEEQEKSNMRRVTNGDVSDPRRDQVKPCEEFRD